MVGDGGLGAEPPAGSRGRAPGEGVRINQNVGGRVPPSRYNRRPCYLCLLYFVERINDDADDDDEDFVFNVICNAMQSTV